MKPATLAPLIELLESGKPLDQDDEDQLTAALEKMDAVIAAAEAVLIDVATPRSRKGMDAIMALSAAVSNAKKAA